jgi:hypothetical protein
MRMVCTICLEMCLSGQEIGTQAIIILHRQRITRQVRIAAPCGSFVEVALAIGSTTSACRCASSMVARRTPIMSSASAVADPNETLLGASVVLSSFPSKNDYRFGPALITSVGLSYKRNYKVETVQKTDEPES